MNEPEEFDIDFVDVPNPDRNRKSVLIVEDDRTHRALMDKILQGCGFATTLAENGIAALSKMESGQHFDLVLMDWDMPGLDGLDTVRAIRTREMEKTRDRTPVIAFTANRAPGDREKCIAAGMDAYLPKDVWTPKWRTTLVDNLQGLISGNFSPKDFGGESSSPETRKMKYDLDAFDVQTLEQVANLLKDDLDIAVDEFLEDAAAYIREIAEGLANKDAEKAARGSHPLKSNSKGFGLVAVSQIAEAINARTRKGEIESAKPLLPQLQEAFRRAEKKLRATIKSAGYQTSR